MEYFSNGIEEIEGCIVGSMDVVGTVDIEGCDDGSDDSASKGAIFRSTDIERVNISGNLDDSI